MRLGRLGKTVIYWGFCMLLDLKESRTKVILQGLSDYIEIVGSNRDRRYKKEDIREELETHYEQGDHKA